MRWDATTRGCPVRGDISVVQYELQQNGLNFPCSIVQMGEGEEAPPSGFLVSCNGNGNCVLGKCCGWRACTMVYASSTIRRNRMRSSRCPYGIVGSAMAPIACTSSMTCMDVTGFAAQLADPLIACREQDGYVAAAIFHHVDFVAVMNPLHRRKRNKTLVQRPHQNFFRRFFSSRDKSFVVPEFMGRKLDGCVSRDHLRVAVRAATLFIYPLKDFRSHGGQPTYRLHRTQPCELSPHWPRVCEIPGGRTLLAKSTLPEGRFQCHHRQSVWRQESLLTQF